MSVPNAFYALVDALIRGETAEATALLDGFPDLLHRQDGTGETALHFSAVENEQNGVAWLLERGADINARDDFGSTPLTDAVRLGYADLCRFLLDNGAGMAFLDNINETALTYAAEKAYETGDVSLLSLLLERATPADLSAAVSDEYARDKMDERLTWAAPEVVDLLKKHGFSLSAPVLEPVLETEANG